MATSGWSWDTPAPGYPGQKDEQEKKIINPRGILYTSIVNVYVLVIRANIRTAASRIQAIFSLE